MAVEIIPITSKEQWLKLRKLDLTASDVGAYLGVAPFKTAAQVYAEKTGAAPEQGETRAMRRGRRDEPAILAALKEERPRWAIKATKNYLRDASIRLGATPDAVAQDPEREGIGIVQCKSVAHDVFVRGWCNGSRENEPEVPVCYGLQTLCEAHLASLAFPDEKVWACIAVHVRSAYEEELYIIDVPRDADTEQAIRETAQNFWRDVAAGRMPQIDFKRDSEVVAKLYPRERSGDEVDLTGDNELPGLLDEYCQVRSFMADLEERKKELSTIFRERLGDAAAGRVAGGGLISWRTVSRPEHVVKAWSGRVLRVTEPRKKKPTEGVKVDATE